MPADHYDVLGVTRDADIAQIKRRYRQLVRQHHPDALPLEQRAAAHNQMLAINLAWTTLSEPAARARYDLSQSKSQSKGFVVHPPRNASPRNVSARHVSARSTASNSTTPNATTARAATTSRTAQNARSSNNVTPNGATSNNATSSNVTSKVEAPIFGSPKRAASNRSSGKSATTSRSRLLTQVFEAAELYFFYGRAGEAIGMCRRVLDQDSENAEAHALLGDIYLDQGRRDVAAFMYERAVKSQPNNSLYRKKWQALTGDSTVHSPSADFSRSYRVDGGSNGGFDSNFADAHSGERNFVDGNEAQAQTRVASSTRLAGVDAARRALQTALGAASLALAILCFLIAHFSAGTAQLNWAPAETIGARVLGFSVLGAGFVGAALPLLEQIELFGARTARSSPIEGAPTGIVAGLAGLAFAPLGWAFAALLSFATRRVNLSLFSCLALGALLAGTLALPVLGQSAAPTLRDALLWWSGRAIFPALMLGWALGSWEKNRIAAER